MKLTKDQTRNIEMLRARHGDDRVVNSMLKQIDETLMTYETKAAALREKGTLTEVGITQELEPLRIDLAEKLDRSIGDLATRVDNLDAKAKRTLPEPDIKLPENERSDLIGHFRNMPASDRRKLSFGMHEQPRLAAAIASIHPQDAALFGISDFEHQRATMIAHGGKRDPASGEYRYPNHQDNQNLEQARTLHLSAVRLVESLKTA